MRCKSGGAGTGATTLQEGSSGHLTGSRRQPADPSTCPGTPSLSNTCSYYHRSLTMVSYMLTTQVPGQPPEARPPGQVKPGKIAVARDVTSRDQGRAAGSRRPRRAGH